MLEHLQFGFGIFVMEVRYSDGTLEQSLSGFEFGSLDVLLWLGNYSLSW